MSQYTDAVERGLAGLEAVSTGICPGCPDCRAAAGFTRSAEFEAAVSGGSVFDEGHFSWAGCDICGSRLGGTFYVWHAIDANGELVHGKRACTDCVMYLANGDEPEGSE